MGSVAKYVCDRIWKEAVNENLDDRTLQDIYDDVRKIVRRHKEKDGDFDDIHGDLEENIGDTEKSWNLSYEDSAEEDSGSDHSDDVDSDSDDADPSKCTCWTPNCCRTDAFEHAEK